MIARLIRIDEITGDSIYDLGDGRRCRLSAYDVRKYGADRLLEQYDVKLSDERVPVFQNGRRIGTLPADFNPISSKSTSFLYDVRPNDFVRVVECWEASKTLGRGDLESIPSFIWDGN